MKPFFITQKGAISTDSTKFLARMILNQENVIGDPEPIPEPKTKSTTVRLDVDLYAKIEEYRKKAKVSRTAVVESLLWSGVQLLEDELMLRGQMEIPEIKKAVKK